ncbi:MAG TPA: HD domain-containing protein [Thermoleophilaceae bacterium]|nr:HD domain-containing protein [Thermoleophilaceae bacterium]
MEQPSLISTKQFVRELADGQAVDSVFVVREQTRRQKKNGETFLKLRLGDRSGDVEAVVWDGVDGCIDCTKTGEVVRVAGPYSVDSRYGATLTVRTVRAAAPEEYEPADLREASPIPLEQMLSDLDDLIATVQQPHLRELLERLLGPDSRTGRSWRLAPAAKRYHQAYRHGLLEHCLSVAQGVSAMAALFPGIDRDVAVTGALLHDIGKIEAYALVGESYDLTDAGRLEGEIPLGYYRVRRAIESIEGFPAGTAQAVVHIVLAHHGKLEHGSPVTPCTREATLVHMIDNLGGTLGSFDRIEKTLADGERWSGFDRALAGSAYFAPPEQDAAQTRAA